MKVLTLVMPFAIRRLSLALTALLVSACDDSDRVFKSPGNEESKPSATLIDSLKGGSNALNAEAQTPHVVASVTYLIEVKTETAGLCLGEFSAEIMSNFSFKLPEAEVQCVGLSIDVANLLNGGNTAGVPATGTDKNGASLADDPLSGISHDGYILSMKTLAGATFDPPRPLLLGPVFQNIDKFKDFARVIDTRLTADAGGVHYDKRGQFKVTVLNNHTSYSNAAIQSKEALNNIIHWKMTAEGFDGVPPTVGIVVPSMEFKWNTRPIMVPYVQIRGNLKGFLKGDNAMLEKATGTITATLIVKDFKLN